MKKHILFVMAFIAPAVLFAQAGAAPWDGETIPQSSTDLYIIGVGAPAATENEARRSAREDALRKLSEYYAAAVRVTYTQAGTFQGKDSDVIDYQLQSDESTAIFSQTVASGLSEIDWSIARTGNTFTAKCLTKIPFSVIKSYEEKNSSRNISERYASVISGQTVLTQALYVYASVLEALEHNPLHRELALYTDPSSGTKSRLDLYCKTAIQNITARTRIIIPRNLTFPDNQAEGAITVTSPDFTTIGGMGYTITVFRGRTQIDLIDGVVGADNSISMIPVVRRIKERGRYSGTIELRYGDISKYTGGNRPENFSFEITGLSAGFIFKGDSLSDTGKGIIKKGIQDGLKNSGIPLQLSNHDSAFNFIVSAHIEQKMEKPLERERQIVRLTIEFQDETGGAIFSDRKEYESYQIDTERSLRFIAVNIRNDTEFFNNIKTALGEE